MQNMETMHLLYGVLLILLLIQNRCIRAQFLLPPSNLDEYDAYGSLLAINEYLAIIAQNDQEYFTIITNPFTNQSNKCTLSYNTIQHRLTSMTRFIYNIAIGIKQNASQLVFSYIDENWQRDVFLTIVFLESISTGCVRVAKRITANMTEFNMREQALVAMDPYGRRAYAIGTYYIVCVEIETGAIWQLDLMNLFDSQDDLENVFFPKAAVITEDHYIVTVGQRFTRLQFLPYLLVLNILSPSNITLMSATQLSEYNFGPSSIDITRYSTMSISLLDHLEQFIIGIPSLDMLLFLSWNKKNANEAPMIMRKYSSSQRGISFGKSVALLDDNTYAVLAYTLSTLPWSTSQVQVSRTLPTCEDCSSFSSRCILSMTHNPTIVL
jgi:hypothetical protein